MDNTKLESTTEDRTKSKGIRSQEIKRRNPTQTTSLDFNFSTPAPRAVYDSETAPQSGSEISIYDSKRLSNRIQTTAKKKKVLEPPEGFEPLGFMPKQDIPPSTKKHWEKLAGQAHTRPMAAVELGCIGCVTPLSLMGRRACSMPRLW
jgi:hypothetical protein